MNIFERQMNLGRELLQINAAVAGRMFQLQSDGVRRYFETNQEFASRLPEVMTDPASVLPSVMQMQREYGETMWSNTNSQLQAGGELLRETVGDVSKALRTAFSADDSADA